MSAFGNSGRDAFGRGSASGGSGAFETVFYGSGSYTIWNYADADHLSDVFYMRLDGCYGRNHARNRLFAAAHGGIFGRSLRIESGLDLYDFSVGEVAADLVYLLSGILGYHGGGTYTLFLYRKPQDA